MEKEHIVIGIEGLVGAGKTSICKKLLKKIPNTVLLHGGNLYRAIVYTLLQEEKNILKLKFKLRKLDITDLMEKYKVDIKIENNESVIYIDGVKISEEELQSKASSLAVSIVGGLADNTRLFKYAREYIENLKKDYNVIVSGRALMEIYPNQDYHIFITADLEERVKRKCIQYSGKETEKEVRKNIVKRDRLQKLAGFYKIYPNTITVDVTNCNSVEESTEKVYNLICKEGIKNNGIC
ncbi:MAG: (d)CMP kinase [Clostridia bacterium]